MTNLSPAAQAVLIAQAKERCLFEWSALNDPPCHPSDPEWNGCIQCIDRCGIAAALRAAADQAQASLYHTTPSTDWAKGWKQGVSDAAQGFRAIAAELEGANAQ